MTPEDIRMQCVNIAADFAADGLLKITCADHVIVFADRLAQYVVGELRIERIEAEAPDNVVSIHKGEV